MITLNGSELAIRTDMTIAGPGAQLLTVSGNNVSRVFNVDDNVALTNKSVTLSGLTISGGRASGSEVGFGGGIRNWENLTIQNSTITGNSAQLDGGGVYSFRGTLMVQNSTVTNSTARRGGGLSGNGTATVQDSTISGNSATQVAGGIYNNRNMTVRNSTISGNSAQGNGGGLFNDGLRLTVQNSTISGNLAAFHGGGLYNNGPATVIDSTISGNTASMDGGGIYVDAPMSVLNSTVSGNFAGGIGGGIYNDDNLTMQNVTVSGNKANNAGGGLFNFTTAVIVNSTFLLNHSDNDNNNNAHNGGGIAPRIGSTITMHNTIVADNFRGSGTSTDDDVSNTVGASSSFNLIGTGGAGGLTHGTNGNQVGIVDPRVTPLQNNGGPTFTHALLPGSSALNAGSNSAVPADTLDFDGDLNTTEPIPFDQRGLGFSRFISVVDIGAIEAPNLAPSAVVLNPNTLNLAENADTTLGIELSTISITDDGFGTNVLSLSGADATRFEIVGNKLRLKAGVSLDFETKTSYLVRVNVDDMTVGNTPDAFADFTLTITNVNDVALNGLVVQSGQSQRSYIRNVDLVFGSGGTDLLELISSNRITLRRFDPTGNGSSVNVPLPAITVSGNTLKFDFGVQGIGGNRNSNLADGLYQFAIDNNGDGSADAVANFHRLLGDTDGDGVVNAEDKKRILPFIGRTYNAEADVNGDGVVNSADLSQLSRAVGRRISFPD